MPSCSTCGASPCDGTKAGCRPGPGNAPVGSILGTLGVSLQSTVDAARRLQHELGLRPYRVFLVWQRRDRGQVARELRRLELMPVRVAPVEEVRWTLGPVGGHAEGSLALSEISPAQVNEDMLRGRLDGREPEPDVEFFYEIVRAARCEGDDGGRPQRYTPASLVGLNGEGFEYRLVVTDQEAPRGRAGEDQSAEQARLPRRGTSMRP
jgi:hypothetical protein